MNRRNFTTILISGSFGVLGGCFSSSTSGSAPTDSNLDEKNKPEDGGLKVLNRTSVQQRLNITIERRPDGPPSGTSTPEPSSTPTEAKELEITVEGENHKLKNEVIETPGLYYVTAEVTSSTEAEGRTGRRWLQFHEAAGGGVSGGHILATIDIKNVHVAQVQD